MDGHPLSIHNISQHYFARKVAYHHISKVTVWMGEQGLSKSVAVFKSSRRHWMIGTCWGLQPPLHLNKILYFMSFVAFAGPAKSIIGNVSFPGWQCSGKSLRTLAETQFYIHFEKRRHMVFELAQKYRTTTRVDCPMSFPMSSRNMVERKLSSFMRLCLRWHPIFSRNSKMFSYLLEETCNISVGLALLWEIVIPAWP